ncbi:hypothetical protein E2C01_007348 [Portunus trituberculatus]|uniref:Uncharacterized protein n=1 Tax=Portunus trituberculatus TaxID=210409 RepID=A0A5B7CYS1_PORTR|nr:hypothetical protein [Portunus trituberculatus]
MIYDAVHSTDLAVQQLEDVQKRACRIILGFDYTNYDHALTILSFPRLASRHREALVRLGRGLLRHPRLRHLLPQPTPTTNPRHINVVRPIRAENRPLPPQSDPHHGASHKQLS